MFPASEDRPLKKLVGQLCHCPGVLVCFDLGESRALSFLLLTRYVVAECHACCKLLDRPTCFGKGEAAVAADVEHPLLSAKAVTELPHWNCVALAVAKIQPVSISPLLEMLLSGYPGTDFNIFEFLGFAAYHDVHP